MGTGLILLLLLASLYLAKKAMEYRDSVSSLLDRESELLEEIASQYERGSHSAKQILAVSKALEERDIKLHVVAMPYRKDLRSLETGKRLENPPTITIDAASAIRYLTHNGIEVLDLGSLFSQLDKEHNLEIWGDDFFHLSDFGRDKVGKVLQQKIDNNFGVDEKKLFMGECFALNLKNVYNKNSNDKSAKALRAYGDRGRVANLLFLFEDDYLADCDAVIWIVPYAFMGTTRIAPFVMPKKGSDMERKKSIQHTVTIESDHELNLEKFAKDLKTMTYPDALIEIPGVIEKSGEEVTLVGVCAQGRKGTGMNYIKGGDKILGVFSDVDAYFLKNPEIATYAYYRTVDDFEKRRIFIEEWGKHPSTINQ